MVFSESLLLYQEVSDYLRDHPGPAKEVVLPKEIENHFWALVDRVSLQLMEEGENFYGYFFFQMDRQLRFDMASPTGVNFKGTRYVMYINPILFLPLTPEQMAISFKHEILHILSHHLQRARDFGSNYSQLAINMAMDIVVNTYLTNLPPDAIDLKWLARQYTLVLPAFKSFEFYVQEIQKKLDDRKGTVKEATTPSGEEEGVKIAFDPLTTHDIWADSDAVDEATLQKLTEKFVSQAQKGDMSNYLGSLVAEFKEEKPDLPWHWYLKKLMGYVEAEQTRTVMRRNRRQPERLDLPGRLRNHRANICVALDISGSISDGEFKQAIQEVLQIVKTYKHEITIVECDNRIRRAYKVKKMSDVQDRLQIGGGTEFSPVIAYGNEERIDLLVYFTDGKGEKRLRCKPEGYRILWVISGRGEGLSLQNSHGLVKKLSSIREETDLDLDVVDKGGFSMANQERLGK